MTLAIANIDYELPTWTPVLYQAGVGERANVSAVCPELNAGLNHLSRDFDSVRAMGLKGAWARIVTDDHLILLAFHWPEAGTPIQWAGTDQMFGLLCKHRPNQDEAWAEVAFMLMQRDADLKDLA